MVNDGSVRSGCQKDHDSLKVKGKELTAFTIPGGTYSPPLPIICTLPGHNKTGSYGNCSLLQSVAFAWTLASWLYLRFMGFGQCE